jgi:Heavy metal associated domain 2
MPNPEKGKKKRRSVLEGFNEVPKLLEEARQAVDEVSRGGQEPGGATRGRKTGPRRPTAVTRKTSTGEGARRQKPSRSLASPAQAAAPVSPPAPDSLGEPWLGLRDCGITVKHAIPGRIRLRLLQMLHNEALAAGLPGFLALVPGVTSVEASTATGSLLITFIPGDLATVKARQNLAVVMHRFFPRLDTESLVRRMLGE